MRIVEPKVLKTGEKQRFGRGFSREELKKVGLTQKEARRLGIPVDVRRKTVHDENVKAVKALLENLKKASKPKRKSKS
ncbi:MAG: ribosomal protein L13e [Candidatus Bathyarchaeia archaeon]